MNNLERKIKQCNFVMKSLLFSTIISGVISLGSCGYFYSQASKEYSLEKISKMQIADNLCYLSLGCCLLSYTGANLTLSRKRKYENQLKE